MKKTGLFLSICFFFANLPLLFRGNYLWDEAVYVGIGKFFWSLGQVGLYEAIRPPMLPFLSGLVWKLSLPLHFQKAIALVFASLTLYFFYVTTKKYLGNLSSLATITFALVPVSFFFSTRVMTGVIATFFVVLGWYFYEKKMYGWMGLVLGLATITRFPAGMFFLFFFLAKPRWKSLTFILPLLVLPLVYFFMGLHPVTALLNAATHQSSVLYVQPWWFYGLIVVQAPLLIFALVGGAFAIKEKRFLLASLAFLPTLYFFLITNQQLRFLILPLPFLVFLSFFGIRRILQSVPSKGLVIFLVLVGILWQALFIGMHLPETTTLPLHATFPGGSVVLSATPYPAFSEVEVIPYYDSIYKGTGIFLTHQNASYIVHSNASFPCELFEDQASCREGRTLIQNHLENKTFLYAERTPAVEVYQ